MSGKTTLCLLAGRETVVTLRAMPEGADALTCGFCGRAAKEVPRLIEELESTICSDRVESFAETLRVVAGEGEAEAELPPADGTWTMTAISYYPGSPTAECSLKIEVAGSSPEERRQIAFEGVSELVLGPTWTNMPYRLDVVSIADRGWDWLRFHVSDGADGQLRFYCREFRAIGR